MKIKIGRYAIELSNQDKVLFGKSGITKGDLIDYYAKIGPIMIPYCNSRPISMHRFPNGIHDEGFYQKDADNYFPDWITTIAIARQSEGFVKYVVIDKSATLVYLANQGCITPHLWLSRVDNVDKPDRMIFDLDPTEKLCFADVQWVAKKLKHVLDDLGLPSFFMLTGSRGAHVVIPLKRLHTFEETRAFAHDVASLLAQKYPEKITVNVHKKERGKCVFIDWLRNGFGATGVAPYAVRALEGAPIAMPVVWDELCKKGMTSQRYTIKNVFKHIESVGDVWQGMPRHAVSLVKARKLLDLMKNKEIVW
jgi:bifunctional non-homologous end joining protein LigD